MIASLVEVTPKGGGESGNRQPRLRRGVTGNVEYMRGGPEGRLVYAAKVP
jgi:hypothetical protein